MVLIGHSMASGYNSATQGRDDIESVIAISSYTDEIPKNDFPNLLVINGEWEEGLTNKTLELFNKIGSIILKSINLWTIRVIMLRNYCNSWGRPRWNFMCKNPT